MSDKASLLGRILRTSKPAEPVKPPDPEVLGEGAAKEAGKKLEGRRARLEAEMARQTR